MPVSFKNPQLNSARNSSMLQEGFFNCIHSNTITLIKYFSDTYFQGDAKRIVYASNDYAFRKRREQDAGKSTSGLNLPFMNIKMTSIETSSNRLWKNRSLETTGFFAPKLKEKLYATPVTISYEATIFTSTQVDSHLFTDNLIWDKALETYIYPEFIMVMGVNHDNFKSISMVDFEIDFDSQFSEADWLEKNKMHTVSLSITCETWLVTPRVQGKSRFKYALSKKFIFSLFSNDDTDFVNNLIEEIEYTEIPGFISIYPEESIQSTGSSLDMDVGFSILSVAKQKTRTQMIFA